MQMNPGSRQSTQVLKEKGKKEEKDFDARIQEDLEYFNKTI